MVAEFTPACLICEQTDNDAPLIDFTYQGQSFSICPQHLPILIHKPHMLADKLPGAKQWEEAEHNH